MKEEDIYEEMEEENDNSKKYAWNWKKESIDKNKKLINTIRSK